MAFADKKGINLASPFKLQAEELLDVRQQVNSITERNELVTLHAATAGLRVYVKADKCSYVYNGSGWDKLATSVYSHPTGDGNLHVPATGTSHNNQVLTAGSTAGSIAWKTITASMISDLPKYSLGSFGITATAAELNYMKGVTSAVQTQLNGKAPSSHSHPAATTSAAGFMPKLSGSSSQVLRGDGTWGSVSGADTKVTNTLGTTTQAYITGTTSSSTNTGTQVFDTGVYLTDTPGEIHADSSVEIGGASLQWDSANKRIAIVFS